MKIIKISCRFLQIPLNYRFSHTTASRKTGESILVILETANFIGHGEGCPRKYVTAETLDSSHEFIEEISKDVVNLSSLENLKEYMEINEESINKNPAAWCAFEMAFLDAYGKETNRNIEGLLNCPDIATPQEFTAVVGVANIEAQKVMIQKYLSLGFNDLKIKLSGKLEDDLPLVNYLKELGTKFKNIRADANNIWSEPKEVIHYLKQLEFNFYAIEEPLASKSIQELEALAKSINTKIILDESFISKNQFSEISESKLIIINLRISKMGGVIRSLEIARQANDRGISIILGCQVAESSLLSRSALTIGEAFKDNIIAREGAFGIHLLSYDIVEDPIQWKKTSILNPNEYNNFSKPGLGLVMSLKRIK